VLPPVVSAAWLAEHAGEVVLADVRWYLDGRSGEAAYRAGHLPGAVFVDVDRWLAGTPSPAAGRHPLPDPAVFARGLGSLGIGDGDAVVAYDDAGGVIAARLVWMLRVTGHTAALLDGGLAAWPGPRATEPVAREPRAFSARPWPRERLATIDEAARPPGVLLDARDRDRYAGELEPVDPRAGHVPGARTLPCRENLAPAGGFVAVEELRRRFAAAGVREGTDVISYCGSGITACHTLLALELAGLGPGRLFAGSWSQWSHDVRRPVAAGPEPG
jgi:thiosulfate/3-mercaptopyruvate sulfurtransferase